MATYDFALPSDVRVSQTTFLAVTWAVTGISLLFLVARLVIRARAFSTLLADDGLVVAAWIMLLASAVTWQIQAGTLYWYIDTLYGRRPPVPAADAFRAMGPVLRFSLAWYILFYTCLWAVKFSFLVFFRRLGFKLHQSRTWWWCVFGISLGGWIACIGTLDYECTVASVAHIMVACQEKLHTYDFQVLYASMAIDIMTDLLILTIPFRILWGVRIPSHKKAILLGVFSFIVATMCVSIIRVVMVAGAGPEKQSLGLDWMFLWSNVESAAAIIVACTASFRQLFVFSSKKKRAQTKAAHHHPWWLRSSGRGLSGPGTSSEIDRRGRVQMMERSVDEGFTHPVVPPGWVHVQQNFEVVSGRPTPEQDKSSYPRSGREFV